MSVQGRTLPASHEIGRTIFRNTVTNFGGKFIALAISFLLTPFLLSRIGATAYGMWMLVASVLSYASIIDVGLSTTLIKYTAEHRTREEGQEAAGLIATATWAYSILGAVVLLFCLAMSLSFTRFFQIPAGQRPVAVYLSTIIGLQMALALPFSTASSVLRGLQRYDIVNYVSGTCSIVGAIGTIVVLILGGGVLSVAAIGLPIAIAAYIVQVSAIRRIAPELACRYRGADRKYLAKLFSFSWPLFVIQCCDLVQARTNQIIIAAYLPVTAVTPYSITRRLASLPRILADQFVKVIIPVASSLDAADDRERLRSVYVVSTRVALSVLVFAGCVTSLLGREILVAWVGSQYAPYAYLVTILTLVAIIETSQWPAGTVLQGMSRHRVLAAVSIFEAVIAVGLSLVLVARLGLFGAGLASLIARAAGSFAIVVPFTMRTLTLSAREMLTRIVFPCLLPAIPGCTVLLLLRGIASASLLALVLVIGAGWIAFVVAYIALASNKLEVQVIRTVVLDLWRAYHARRRPAGAGQV